VLELDRVSLDRNRPTFDLRKELDPGEPEPVRQQRQRVIERSQRRHAFGANRALSGEQPHVVDDPRHAPDLITDQIEIVDVILDELAAALPDGFRESLNGCQGLVELVGHPRTHLSQGGELTGLENLLLSELQLPVRPKQVFFDLLALGDLLLQRLGAPNDLSLEVRYELCSLQGEGAQVGHPTEQSPHLGRKRLRDPMLTVERADDPALDFEWQHVLRSDVGASGEVVDTGLRLVRQVLCHALPHALGNLAPIGQMEALVVFREVVTGMSQQAEEAQLGFEQIDGHQREIELIADALA